MYPPINFQRSNHRTVERCQALPHFSGRTKFRFCLVVIGMLSFFSSANFLNNRLYNNSVSIFFLDNTYYLVHNIFLAAFAFSMIPLADFQVFEYNHSFWNVFKFLSTFNLLAETESICQFVYSFSTNLDLDTTENIEAVTYLILLAIIRWTLLAMLYWKGSKFLDQIQQSRHLPLNFYKPFWWSSMNYVFFHLIGFCLVTQWDYSVEQTLLAEFVLATIYLAVQYFLVHRGSKKRLVKVNQN